MPQLPQYSRHRRNTRLNLCACNFVIIGQTVTRNCSLFVSSKIFIGYACCKERQKKTSSLKVPSDNSKPYNAYYLNSPRLMTLFIVYHILRYLIKIGLAHLSTIGFSGFITPNFRHNHNHATTLVFSHRSHIVPIIINEAIFTIFTV